MNPLEQMLLSNLRKKDPKLYQIYTETKNTGRDPYDVMAEMYRDGKISDADLENASRQMARFGKTIPEEAMARIKSGAPKEKADRKYDFRGLF